MSIRNNDFLRVKFFVNPIRVSPPKNPKINFISKNNKYDNAICKGISYRIFFWYDNWVKNVNCIRWYRYISSACCVSSCNICVGLYIYTSVYPAVICSLNVQIFNFQLNKFIYVVNQKKRFFVSKFFSIFFNFLSTL